MFDDYKLHEKEMRICAQMMDYTIRPRMYYCIWSGNIDNNNVPYVLFTIYPGEYKTFKQKYDQEQRIRISLLEPIYLQSATQLNWFQRIWFNKIMHEMWDEMIYWLNWLIGGALYQFPLDQLCPDYMQLPIITS